MMNLSATVVDVVVIVGDECDICSVQPSQLVDALVCVAKVQKNLLRSEN